MNVRVQDMIVETCSCNKGLSIWQIASEPRMERLKVEREHENAGERLLLQQAELKKMVVSVLLAMHNPSPILPALRPLHTRHHPPHDTLSHLSIIIFALPSFGAISRSYRLTERWELANPWEGKARQGRSIQEEILLPRRMCIQIVSVYRGVCEFHRHTRDRLRSVESFLAIICEEWGGRRNWGVWWAMISRLEMRWHSVFDSTTLSLECMLTTGIGLLMK